MSSRDKMLAAVKAAQPDVLPLPENSAISITQGDLKKFTTVLESIGGKVYEMNSMEEVAQKVEELFPEAKRVISSITTVERYLMQNHKEIIHHSLHDVDVAIVEGMLAVAENGAVWVKEEDLKIRVLPFICEHLVAVVAKKSLVNNMHEAYEIIGTDDYGFGTFIAGPSKTADIEQSLVLGAHGPKSMTVLVIK